MFMCLPLSVAFMAFVAAPAVASETLDPDPHAVERSTLKQYGALAEYLNAHGDARQQLVAALLLVFPVAQDPPPDLEAVIAARKVEAGAIFVRVRAGSDDPWVLWIAAVGCPFEPSVCDEDGALRALQRIDGDNAAVWMASLDRARVVRSRADALVALQAMAASKRFDTYARESVHAWTDAFAFMPTVVDWRPAEVIVDGRPARPLSADQTRTSAMLSGVMRASEHSTPSLTVFPDACRPDDASDSAWRQACRGAAQVMVDSEDRIARAISLPVAFQFAADDPVEQARLEALNREEDWLTQSYSKLRLDGFNGKGLPDPGEDELMLAAWRISGSELAMFRHVLQAHGVPLEPPADHRVAWTLAEQEAERLARLPARSDRRQ